MDDYSALNQIKLLTQSSTLSSQLDIELLVLHILNIDKNALYRDNPSFTEETSVSYTHLTLPTICSV